jgi:rhodanese-related sulfurtransferase
MKTRYTILALFVLLLAAGQPVMTASAGAEPCVQEEKPLTYMHMVEEAMVQVDGISAADAYYRLKQDPNTLLIDVSDSVDVLTTGLVVGGVNISLGMLPIRADLGLPAEFQYVGLQDRSRPIITTCQGGPNGARAAQLLNDMGFEDVVYIEGGMEAWVAANQPTNLNVIAPLEPGEKTFRPGEY